MIRTIPERLAVLALAGLWVVSSAQTGRAQLRAAKPGLDASALPGESCHGTATV
jgi:hypothetical protein